MDVTLAPEAIFRGGGQIIPTSRRVKLTYLLFPYKLLIRPRPVTVHF